LSESHRSIKELSAENSRKIEADALIRQILREDSERLQKENERLLSDFQTCEKLCADYEKTNRELHQQVNKKYFCVQEK
jgi:hypothetical protein